MSLGGSDGAERIFGDMVSTNYFSVLGTRPHVGRLFAPQDSEQPGAAPLAVLSYRFWTRRFNGDPAVVGADAAAERPAVHGHRRDAGRLSRHDGPDQRRLGADEHGRRAVAAPLGVDADQPRERVAGDGRAPEARRVGAPGRRRNWPPSAGRSSRSFPEANRGKGLRVAPLSPIPGDGAAGRRVHGGADGDRRARAGDRLRECRRRPAGAGHVSAS